MSDTYEERDIDDILMSLKDMRQRDRRCALLIGAGCSLSAGIPLAGGIVKAIEQQHPSAYRNARTKTYADCMQGFSIDWLGAWWSLAHRPEGVETEGGFGAGGLGHITRVREPGQHGI